MSPRIRDLRHINFAIGEKVDHLQLAIGGNYEIVATAQDWSTGGAKLEAEEDDGTWELMAIFDRDDKRAIYLGAGRYRISTKAILLCFSVDRIIEQVGENA
jgi:hypothetical protein